MSSAFDSEVYAERQRLPGVSVNLARLMQHLLWGMDKSGAGPESVSLTVEYRPDVDTSQWWTIRWGGPEGSPAGRFAAAKELELCLFRAAVLARREDERAKRYAGIPDDRPAPESRP